MRRPLPSLPLVRRVRVRRRLVAALTAAAIACALATAVEAGPAHAQAGAITACGQNYGIVDWNTPASTTPITELAVRILVGDDDIRAGDEVYAYVHIVNARGDAWFPRVSGVEPINALLGYPNGSLLQKKIPLTGSNLGVITPENVVSIYIDYYSAVPFLSSADNWDMSALRVLYPKSANLDPPYATAVDWNQYDQLLYGPGSPWLHRFKVNCDTEGGFDWRTDNPLWHAG